MLKILEENKTISASLLYKYADGEYNRVKNKRGENSELAVRMKTLRDVIYEMVCDLPDANDKSYEWVVECLNRKRCPACGHSRNTETQLGWNFCPNCGAKFRGTHSG